MTKGMVYLVGAGPGHPGLLTVRAVECLAQADLLIYDKLVPARILDYVSESAVKVCVTKLAAEHKDRYAPVLTALIEAARKGQTVVRLKGGDPLLFGRGGEEAEALRQAGILFEIVPGVTAALGAAAFAGIPLTHRLVSSAVALVTGHEKLGINPGHLDWKALAHFPGTLVVYMGLARLSPMIHDLVRYGKALDTPAALVHWATTGEQQTLEATLGELPHLAQAAGITSPSLVIVGPVVRLRNTLAWFEHRPLFGKRVLVTRPRQQSLDLVRRLEELGAVAFALPAVDIRPPDDWAPVDQAIDRLAEFHWLVFTSANGVRSFLERLPKCGKDLRVLGNLRLAAIGPKTADALQTYHLEPDVVPERFQSEDLALALKGVLQPGQRVLLARADRGRELLREELGAVAAVEQIAVYSQVDAVPRDHPILDNLRRGGIDYLTVTSSNIARALFHALDEPALARLTSGQVRVVSISPVTSEAVRQMGVPVAAEAAEATMEGVVEALIHLAEKEKPVNAGPAGRSS